MRALGGGASSGEGGRAMQGNGSGGGRCGRHLLAKQLVLFSGVILVLSASAFLVLPFALRSTSAQGPDETAVSL